MAEVRCEVSSYTISALPESEDPYGGTAWAIQVDNAGFGKWAVRHLSRSLSTEGKWEHEPIPSSRTDRWLSAHRFDLDTALDLAKKAAPGIVVNGMNPDAVMEHAARHGRAGAGVDDA